MPRPRRPGAASCHTGRQAHLFRSAAGPGWRLACKAVTREAVEIAVPVQEQQGFSALAAEAADEGALSLAADHDYGLAVDIGTTTLAAALVDCTDGKILATATAVNSQRSFGADVVSRIGAACMAKARPCRRPSAGT